jgi:hypothetical protein
MGACFMKYYGIKLMAALCVMGSPGVGFLAGAAYGKWIGWLGFILAGLIGIMLHFIANKNRRA